MQMKTMKLFLVCLICFLAARGWVSCKASSRRFLSRGGEAEGSQELVALSRRLLSESDEDSSDTESELLLPDDTDSEKVEDAAEKEQKAAKPESNGLTEQGELEMEKEKLQNVKRKQTKDESTVTKDEEGDFLLEAVDNEEEVGEKKEYSGARGEKGQADSLAEKESFEGEVFQEKKRETKAKTEREGDSSPGDKALDTPTIELQLMEDELSEESGVGDKGEAGSLTQQKSPEKLIDKKGQQPKVERETEEEEKMERQETLSSASDTPIDLELQGEGFSGEVSAVDVAETETKGGGALVLEEGAGSRGEKKKKKKKKSMNMESKDTKYTSEEKLTSKNDREANPKGTKDSSYGDRDDVTEKPLKGGQALKVKDRVKNKKDVEKTSSKDKAELEMLVTLAKEIGTSDDTEGVQEEGGEKLEKEEVLSTYLKPSLEKQQDSMRQIKKDKEKNPPGKPTKEMKTSKQPESKEEVELNLTGNSQNKAKKGKEEASSDSGLEPQGGLDMAADEQVKAPDTAKLNAKSKKKKVKKEKLVDKAKKEKVKDVEKRNVDKGVQEGTSPDSSLSGRGNMEAKGGKEATKFDTVEAVNVNSDDGGVTPKINKPIAINPSKESKDFEKDQKLEEEEDDEYGDFMQDFTDLPSKFQDTAQKVAGHLGPNIQRITDTSKGYFNKANQQITESFSPVVGKQFAPFFASLVSYGLLLLPLAVVVILFEHIRALLSLQKVLLFVNIYLAAYFATLLLATFIMGEPMNFFYKSSASGYVHLQLLQALGYIIYLIMQTFDMVSSCSSETLAVKVTVVLQWLVAIMIGFHYYVTVFHRAMAMKGPHTSWKIYGVYSIAFLVLCLFARIKRVKKGYSQLGHEEDDKKN